MFIDTHSHIYTEEFDNDLPEMLSRAAFEGIDKIFVPAIDSTTHAKMIQLCKRNVQLFPMIGLHPCSVKIDFLQEIELIEKLLNQEQFFAIGETGIDLYWDKTFYNEQVEALKLQCQLAVENSLPIVLHTRQSTAETIDVVAPFVKQGLNGVFHCFSGDLAQAKKVVEMGFYLGIGGVVTYKKSGLDEIVREISLEHLVLETDAPYLPPVPYRGKRNESSYIPYIAQKIADIKKVGIDEVAAITTANSLDLFRITGKTSQV